MAWRGDTDLYLFPPNPVYIHTVEHKCRYQLPPPLARALTISNHAASVVRIVVHLARITVDRAGIYSSVDRARSLQLPTKPALLTR